MNTTASVKQPLVAEHHLDIGKFSFYPNILVGEFAEGCHVTKKNAWQAIELTQELYGTTRPLVYVSHRKHSYSMDPMGYKEVVDMFPNFKGFAIVSQNKYRRMIASLEKLFIKKPIGVFYTLEEAFQWADEILKSEG